VCAERAIAAELRASCHVEQQTCVSLTDWATVYLSIPISLLSLPFSGLYAVSPSQGLVLATLKFHLQISLSPWHLHYLLCPSFCWSHLPDCVGEDEKAPTDNLIRRVELVCSSSPPNPSLGGIAHPSNTPHPATKWPAKISYQHDFPPPNGS
jgi:hypothetical protein